jgi:MFS family permease
MQWQTIRDARAKTVGNEGFALARRGRSVPVPTISPPRPRICRPWADQQSRPQAAQGLGLSRTAVFGLFSGALLLSAVLGPSVGRAIDNRGGRGVLALSNLVLAAGLVLLGIAQGFLTLALAWAVLGVGMAMGLYDPAFATLTGLYGRAARGPITGITLIAGFASTVGWPLSAFLDAQFGWRAACVIWAALHIVIGRPLNRLLIPRAPPPVRASEVAEEASPARAAP